MSHTVWYDNMRCYIKENNGTAVLVWDETFTKEKAISDGFVPNNDTYELILSIEDTVDYEGILCHVIILNHEIALIPVLWNNPEAKEYQLYIIKSLGVRQLSENYWGYIYNGHSSKSKPLPKRKISHSESNASSGTNKETYEQLTFNFS